MVGHYFIVMADMSYLAPLMCAAAAAAGGFYYVSVIFKVVLAAAAAAAAERAAASELLINMTKLWMRRMSEDEIVNTIVLCTRCL